MVWVAWRPVSSTRWRRWACRAVAMASGMTTACSNRTLWKVSRKSRRITGLNMVIRGNSSVSIPVTKCALVAASSTKARKCAGWRPKRSWRWPMTRSFLALTPTLPTPYGCGARRPATKSTSASSTRATTLRRWKIKTTPRTCRACSIRMIRPTQAASCACVRNISWSPRRCRTF